MSDELDVVNAAVSWWLSMRPMGVAIAAFGGTASGFVVGWVLSLRFARFRAAHRRHVEIMRQGGVLYVDRDQAVGKHLNSLRRMVRPGNRH